MLNSYLGGNKSAFGYENRRGWEGHFDPALYMVNCRYEVELEDEKTIETEPSSTNISPEPTKIPRKPTKNQFTKSPNKKKSPDTKDAKSVKSPIKNRKSANKNPKSAEKTTTSSRSSSKDSKLTGRSVNYIAVLFLTMVRRNDRQTYY